MVTVAGENTAHNAGIIRINLPSGLFHLSSRVITSHNGSWLVFGVSNIFDHLTYIYIYRISLFAICPTVPINLFTSTTRW